MYSGLRNRGVCSEVGVNITNEGQWFPEMPGEMWDQRAQPGFLETSVARPEGMESESLKW